MSVEKIKGIIPNITLSVAKLTSQFHTFFTYYFDVIKRNQKCNRKLLFRAFSTFDHTEVYKDNNKEHNIAISSDFYVRCEI